MFCLVEFLAIGRKVVVRVCDDLLKVGSLKLLEVAENHHRVLERSIGWCVMLVK